MVVAGRSQFTGSDSRAAAQAIVQAARAEVIPLHLDPPTLSGKTLSATLTLSAPTTARADLYAAIVDPEDSTQVQNGENGGRTLHHVGVVRSLSRIGTLSALGNTPLTFTLDTPELTRPIRLVVFAQTPDQGPILGTVASGLLIAGTQDHCAKPETFTKHPVYPKLPVPPSI